VLSQNENLQILTIVKLGLKDLKPFIEKGVSVTAKKLVTQQLSQVH